MKYLLILLLFIPVNGFSKEYLLTEERLRIDNIFCLAQNIYFEARNQSELGKEAVTEVVLNRVKSHKYPNEICEVVKQAKQNSGRIIRHSCQFSWYCDGKPDTPGDYRAWVSSMEIAQRILIKGTRNITEGSTHYHSVKVSPYWNRALNRVVQIDDHIFYKE